MPSLVGSEMCIRDSYTTAMKTSTQPGLPSRERRINYSSSQTSLTIQATRAVCPYNFVCSPVSSADSVVKPKFEQLQTTYANDEIRLPARSVLSAREGGVPTTAVARHRSRSRRHAVNTYKHIYLHTRALSGQHPDPCALSALEPFFGDFSAARPRLLSL